MFAKSYSDVGAPLHVTNKDIAAQGIHDGWWDCKWVLDDLLGLLGERDLSWTLL